MQQYSQLYLLLFLVELAGVLVSLKMAKKSFCTCWIDAEGNSGIQELDRREFFAKLWRKWDQKSWSNRSDMMWLLALTPQLFSLTEINCFYVIENLSWRWKAPKSGVGCSFWRSWLWWMLALGFFFSLLSPVGLFNSSCFFQILSTPRKNFLMKGCCFMLNRTSALKME